jgi:hypothetical protein
MPCGQIESRLKKRGRWLCEEAEAIIKKSKKTVELELKNA